MLSHKALHHCRSPLIGLDKIGGDDPVRIREGRHRFALRTSSSGWPRTTRPEPRNSLKCAAQSTPVSFNSRSIKELIQALTLGFATLCSRLFFPTDIRIL